MLDLEKVKTKAYIEGRHTLTLTALMSRIYVSEEQSTALEKEIYEHKDAIDSLKEHKSQVKARVAGYKKALLEKQ